MDNGHRRSTAAGVKRVNLAASDGIELDGPGQVVDEATATCPTGSDHYGRNGEPGVKRRGGACRPLRDGVATVLSRRGTGHEREFRIWEPASFSPAIASDYGTRDRAGCLTRLAYLAKVIRFPHEATGQPTKLARDEVMVIRLLCGVVILLVMAGCHATPDRYEVVVYGGTSSGVVAAVKVAGLGKSVVLIEPGKHLGGLTSGGLGATDIGNKQVIGGMSREFYRRVGKAYGRDEAWTFEPHVAERIFNQMIRAAQVPAIFGERLDLVRGVNKRERRIDAIVMESGRTFHSKMFIDATYEGDLMATAGVTYHVGRESNATYDETLNGVQTRHAVHHQFIKPVDPYVAPGDPSSGLLPGINPEGPGAEGSGDHRVQAYCFRLCTTDVPRNRRPWPKPDDYDPLRYELLLRNFEAGDQRVPWHPVMMPNRKTDTNNNHAVSTDYIGMNYDYPDGDYATRERIIREHESYQKGLMWTLANSPRVPEKVRAHFRTWGLARDEFTDNDNWPHQLYVREARRMVSDYVMTQHHCQGRRVAEDSVGLAAYTMDSHNMQRYVDENGQVRNEGDVQVGGFPPYPISYRSIVPKRSECTNLLVPVCLSASHIAFGSIRMEPVFMVLGESAATAAVQALEADLDVQAIEYDRLAARLLADGQILRWPSAEGRN